VVDNSGDRAELERQVADTVRKIRKQVWTPIWLVSWLVPPIGLLNALFTVMWRLVIKRVGKGSRGGQRKRT
jgi:dephospho-CoA kinase